MLRTAISILWKNKKQIWVFWLFCSLFFILMFPWSEAIEKVVRNSQKKSPVPFEFSDMKLKLFPPSVVFHDFSIDQKVLDIDLRFDRLSFSLAMKQWIALKPAFRVQLVKGVSSLKLTFSKRKKTIEGEEIEHWDVQANSPRLNLSVLTDFFPDIEMGGVISFYFTFKGSSQDLENSSAFFSLEGSKIDILKANINSNLGLIKLPNLKWSQLDISARLKESNASIESFILGSATDRLYVQMKGGASLASAYGRVRLNSYDIQTNIKADKRLELSLLDLFLLKAKQENLNSNIYKARIRGRGFSAPRIEKLEQF